MRWSALRRPAGALVPVLAALALAGVALAGGATICVTASTSSWTQDDTRPGGTVRFTNDYGAPPGLGRGSLELTTAPLPSTSAKAGLYTHTMAGTPLSEVYALSYWTYQAVTVPPNPPHAAASYQLQIDTDGVIGDGQGFTTLVFEPYQNPQQPIIPGTWQRWDVDAGLFWSSRTVAQPPCLLVAGAGGPPMYTLAEVQTLCPNAVVVGIGVNIGSNNPGYTVATDGVQFNKKTYNFEVRCGDRGEHSCGDDDDDRDGLNDRREPHFLTLLGLADSDFDGILDGNDDANMNSQNDEDEDDDDCRDRDHDGNGIDDEDEDDEDHDRRHHRR
jgi:hypothetical protein